MGTRFFANAGETPTHLPGLVGDKVKFVLPGPQALLLHQSLGELVHAIRGVRFEEQIGVSRGALEEMLGELQSWVDACEYDSRGVIVVRDALGNPIGKFEREYEPIQIRALRNSLEIAMLDLGRDEFSTITGFTLAEGKQLLDVWNAALLDPLHLGRHSGPVSH